MIPVTPACNIIQSVKNGKVTVRPLYILSFPLAQFSKLTEAEIFLKTYPNPEKLTHTADILRWYRHKNNLLQKEAADAIGVDRSTYIHYESREHNLYPADKLKALSQLFGVPVSSLLDDYNKFIYEGQGEKIKALRNRLNLKQAEFAKLLSTTVKTVKLWEEEKTAISKNMYKRLLKYL